MILLLFVVVVLSASTLLSDYQQLCEVLMKLPRNMYHPDTDAEASRLILKVLDDKENVTLTGWGLFHLNRKFFLTAAATLGNLNTTPSFLKLAAPASKSRIPRCISRCTVAESGAAAWRRSPDTALQPLPFYVLMSFKTLPVAQISFQTFLRIPQKCTAEQNMPDAVYQWLAAQPKAFFRRIHKFENG
ncbi:hypothetical protein AVEN_187200-1 [Araneus ventricosus]|uniref:Uncharacterized protein n=2 Tax=Araneus ventricosus TaxID=182803 RepID=A0A4Y2PP70_ARAVE|nr:hypothetical protein AVEN_108762-1 [Araneus ventricosus]GBN51896.1 hypothetical protein AVEN_173473-1 [Araneus ventricosus]GBN51900.1 hypothetical protein AVEN_187200-1 [Araneus ventricosus]